MSLPRVNETHQTNRIMKRVIWKSSSGGSLVKYTGEQFKAY